MLGKCFRIGFRTVYWLVVILTLIVTTRFRRMPPPAVLKTLAYWTIVGPTARFREVRRFVHPVVESWFRNGMGPHLGGDAGNFCRSYEGRLLASAGSP